MQNINIKLNPDDLLDISSQVPIKTGTAQQITNVSDVLTGPQGPQGPRGETGPRGPRGETGPRGPQGETGATGQSANISIGTVTTLPAGSNATVVNSGTSMDAVLDFGIPQGIQGETGPRGPKGDTGDAGPRGPQGETGPQGQSANISIGTVTTLPAGSNATVVNSGTSMDAVLDFGIPQGIQGETGPRGPKGDTGDAGPRGPRGETGPRGTQGPAGTITAVVANPLSADKTYSSTDTTLQSLTITSGTWLVFWCIRMYGDGSTSLVYGNLKKDSTTLQSIASNIPSYGQNFRGIINNVYKYTASSSTTLKTTVRGSNVGNVSASSSYLFAIKI